MSYGTEGDMHAPLFANQVVQVREPNGRGRAAAISRLGLHSEVLMFFSFPPCRLRARSLPMWHGTLKLAPYQRLLPPG